MRYYHRQFGAFAIYAHVLWFLLFVAVVFSVTLLPALSPVIWATLAVFGLTAVTFCTLTTTIDDTEFCAAFGLLKWPTKRAALNEIAGAVPTRLSFFSGWGIRVTTRGWLYNVSGRSAVIIGLTNGKQFLVGSDEAEALANAINAALPQPAVFTGIRGIR